MKPRGLFCRINSPSAAGPSRSLSKVELIPRTEPQPPDAPLYSTTRLSLAIGLPRPVTAVNACCARRFPIAAASRRSADRLFRPPLILLRTAGFPALLRLFDQPRGRFRAAPLQGFEILAFLLIVVAEESLDFIDEPWREPRRRSGGRCASIRPCLRVAGPRSRRSRERERRSPSGPVRPAGSARRAGRRRRPPSRE